MTVTAAEGTRITELAGHSPLVQAQIAINELPESARDLAVSGLHLGVAMDEYVYEHGHGDFVARGLLAADDLDGSISVEEAVPVGATVQFLLRDSTEIDPSRSSAASSPRATRRRRTRTSSSLSPTCAARSASTGCPARSCSRATGAAARCSPRPSTTSSPYVAPSASSMSAASSPPARSGRSAAATTCTA
jgi:small ligand-binding sensory domain FIST